MGEHRKYTRNHGNIFGNTQEIVGTLPGAGAIPSAIPTGMRPVLLTVTQPQQRFPRDVCLQQFCQGFCSILGPPGHPVILPSPSPLTDVVVLVAGSELEAQREGGEELELLGELEGPIGGVGAVALPALEATLPVVAGRVALVVDHVEDVPLHPLRQRLLVVRAVDVQVVVDAHLHRVVPAVEPAEEVGQWVTDTSALILETPPRSPARWNHGVTQCFGVEGILKVIQSP